MIGLNAKRIERYLAWVIEWGDRYVSMQRGLKDLDHHRPMTELLRWVSMQRGLKEMSEKEPKTSLTLVSMQRGLKEFPLHL